MLYRVDPAGIIFRGISIDSFEDWLEELRQGEEVGLGLATLFVPLFRVERIYLDEPVGGVESLAQRFARKIGIPAEEYLGRAPLAGRPVA
jgi:hypothetical protein